MSKENTMQKDEKDVYEEEHKHRPSLGDRIADKIKKNIDKINRASVGIRGEL